MNYLQSLVLKITLAWVMACSTGFALAQKQELAESLHIADSLFRQQQYTQSFQIYNNILEIGQMSSPAMLLKMAFIKEGLGEISQALYYLNLNYLKTSDEAVLEKMEQLARAHNLHGYDYTEKDFLINLYYQYYNPINFGVIALTPLLFIGVLYRKYKLKERPVTLGAFFVLLNIGIFYSINFGLEFRQGIINNPATYIMAEPSSSSRVVDIVKEGHRIKILGQNDIWLKTEWRGEKAYVKITNIQPILR